VNELFDRETLIALLTELGARLDARGVIVEIYVVDGTAMMLAYDRQRLTRDIDATWEQSQELIDEVAAMSAEHDLPRDWLNDRVRPLLPRVLDSEQIEALSIPGLRVSVASPRHMIAMKARAARDVRDFDDLALLCEREGITEVAEVITIAEEIWGAGMLRDETVFSLRIELGERSLQP